MSFKFLRNYYPVVFLIGFVFITTSLLVITNNIVRVEIENKLDTNTLEIIKVIFPEACSYKLNDNIYNVYDKNRHIIGYSFLASGRGFLWQDTIIVLVGLEDEETIKSISIISHSEHWGGSGEDEGPPLDFDPFVSQFVELKVDNCFLSKDGGYVDGIAGATKSCRAVVDIVRNAALENVKSIKSIK